MFECNQPPHPKSPELDLVLKSHSQTVGLVIRLDHQTKEMGVAKFKVGDRVKHATFRWLTESGTVVDFQSELSPFVTESAIIPARYKVKWDDLGDSGWLSETELVGA